MRLRPVVVVVVVLGCLGLGGSYGAWVSDRQCGALVDAYVGLGAAYGWRWGIAGLEPVGFHLISLA